MKTFGSSRGASKRDRIHVGISEYEVVADGETLVVYGVGACVAIALYDPASGVAGLAHTLLARQEDGHDSAPGKFVDTAIQTMLREMVEAGASYGTVKAKLVGGADIFELPDLSKGVGEQNVTVARAELDSLDVPVVAEAVGGDEGRSVEFDTETGVLELATVHGRAGTL